VVEDGSLGRPGRPRVVVARDHVQELRANVRLQPTGLLFDEAQAEMDVAEKSSLVGGEEKRTAIELSYTAYVVEQGCREQEVAAQARMDLSGFTAEAGDGHRVLEQPAGVGVMCIGRRGKCSQARAKVRIADEASK